MAIVRVRLYRTRVASILQHQRVADENLRPHNLWEGIEMLASIMTMPR